MTTNEEYNKQIFEAQMAEFRDAAVTREQQRSDSKCSLELQRAANAESLAHINLCREDIAKHDAYRAEAKAINAELVALAQGNNALLQDIIDVLQSIRSNTR